LQSFWGSDSGLRLDNNDDSYYLSHEWHPELGWFLSLIGGWIIIFGGIASYRGIKLDDKLPRVKNVKKIALNQGPAITQQFNIIPPTNNPNTQFLSLPQPFNVPNNSIIENSRKNVIYCNVCGQENPAKNKFCWNCGNRLEGNLNQVEFTPQLEISELQHSKDIIPKGFKRI